ncbi:ABC transporter substrate-binding protein [Roseococcus sp. XZZS9]|uniref:ABC transporter substrate-binding protein n=1 Tax=Roseococcus pinisoli TaxID=2835040 RepID=A0ABS5QG36_9PROT|nr:ABC transporter substrate-binding protein [Roseococcus pinisoli]MBS7812650.1 ABC transporter substrate-binding protein [Roseococcus pinisoli]
MLISRRAGLGGAAAILAAPRLGSAQLASRTLRFLPQANLASLDPVWSTATIVRNHGLMIYDLLYGLDSNYEARPQMAAGHEISADGLTWNIRLRDGLKFHDGEPVRARDCVASILRWSKRDVLGSRLVALGEEVSAPDDQTIRIRLKKPWPGLAWALGKPSANICAIMPERVAQTDPFTQINDPTGSGPFRFRRDLFRPGDVAIYERFDGYVPRSEPTDFMTGAKQVHFDRVEWRVMPDPATAGAALQNNEGDWLESPLTDLLPLLRRNRDIEVGVINPAGNMGVLRFNFLHKPFDDLAVRRSILSAVNQRDFMDAAIGTDRALSVVPCGVFTPGTPLANDAGLEVLSGRRDLDAAKAALRASSYDGRRIAMMSATDMPVIQNLSEVAADLLRRVGFNIDFPAMDWGTQIQRRTNRGPVEQGGWSVFCTTWEGLDVSVPGSHQPLRGNGAQAWSGWPTMPRLEALREQWFDAADQASAKRIAEEIQRVAWEEVPFIPLGLVRPPQAWRRSITGIVRGGPALFWGVRRA